MKKGAIATNFILKDMKMNYEYEINELSGQITDYHRILNKKAPWLIGASITVLSLSDSHLYLAMLACLCIAIVYMELVVGNLFKKQDKPKFNCWSISISKAISKLEESIKSGCAGEQREKYLALLKKKCVSQLRFRNALNYRLFLLAMIVFWIVFCIIARQILS